ncbi:MBL fold metallo-hydrolase RNA specificity domain-containing protein, partial [Acinetobacter baumannii]
RIAEDQHPDIRLEQGDLVIFSSRTIPGNERVVGRIQNRLVEMGCDLVTDNEALVHVTGHPRRDEMRELYGWIKPRIAIPMHGEAR